MHDSPTEPTGEETHNLIGRRPFMDIGTILTSTVVSAVVSGLISLYGKQREYVNEYYKIILNRRITAYEQLESLIVSLKVSVVDSDGKPYHLLFSQEDACRIAHTLLQNILIQALWLSREAFEKSQELNYLLFSLKPEGAAIDFGRAHYEKIGKLRHDLEQIVATDLIKLHDLKGFLRQKKKEEHKINLVSLNR
jgi:hypothetical protein